MIREHLTTRLDLVVFEGLPDQARLWVHGFEEALAPGRQEQILRRLERFQAGWDTHGAAVRSATSVAYDRFVLTAAYSPAGISGCSTDRFIRNFKSFRNELGVDGLNGGLVYFRDRESQIRVVPHLVFYEVVQSGQVGAETIVFDTLIENLGNLRAGKFEVRFEDCWHARTYPLPVEC